MKGLIGSPAGSFTTPRMLAACVVLLPAAIMAVGAGTPTGTRNTDCFAAGTAIGTPAGDRRIEELQAGDVVLCRNGRGDVVSCRLTNVTRRTVTSVRRFVFDDGRELSMAGDHMLRTATGWVAASEVATGTTIQGRKGPHALVSVRVVEGDHDVCDITPDGSGAFFANGIVVHR